MVAQFTQRVGNKIVTGSSVAQPQWSRTYNDCGWRRTWIGLILHFIRRVKNVGVLIKFARRRLQLLKGSVNDMLVSHCYHLSRWPLPDLSNAFIAHAAVFGLDQQLCIARMALERIFNRLHLTQTGKVIGIDLSQLGQLIISVAAPQSCQQRKQTTGMRMDQKLHQLIIGKLILFCQA